MRRTSLIVAALLSTFVLLTAGCKLTDRVRDALLPQLRQDIQTTVDNALLGLQDEFHDEIQHEHE